VDILNYHIHCIALQSASAMNYVIFDALL